MTIETYHQKDEQEVVELILAIQQKEFGVAVTIHDQPDLLDVVNFYCKDNGNFWVAKSLEKVIGTIALIDIGNHQSALRKMFVKKEWRGKEKGIGQLLLNTVISWCKQKGISDIFLGTVEQLHAAKRFYEKNGFERINKQNLPQTFSLMQVDTDFYRLYIDAE